MTKNYPSAKNETVIAVEYLPGQYDQRADSAAQCIQIVTLKSKPVIAAAKLIILDGNFTKEEISGIKKYLINPVDSREAEIKKPSTLDIRTEVPGDVQRLDGFINLPKPKLEELRQSLGLAMSQQDLLFCREYFRDKEKRDPFITEIKMLDTYWSDHCRHTTFETRIKKVRIQDSPLTDAIHDAYERFLHAYEMVYPDRDASKYVSLMNIATMSMKQLRRQGKLNDLEVSGEINACSIIRDVNVNGKKEEWLVMFKNETHNHPTEVEPFGGAATCLGGAIRDPLSGRSFVHQAMRVTGSGNPMQKIEDTLPGKLPQRKITTEAAHGYSSYGNQIGLPTGQVTEIYHDGYIAKRMEVGAVIGAVPRSQIVREEPVPGDAIILVGGRTGRDGIGGATGSSKEHTEDSIHSAGAEVQKGNPPEERKLLRLFRKPEVTKLIKKSNDFGAGGVSVAIGELADGLDIFLDNVPKKYDGLDGTELALSESQERMAVVVSNSDAETFKKLAAEENLEATEIATVTAENRLKMFWRDKAIVDISREFIDTNGVRQEATVVVNAPPKATDCFNNFPRTVKKALDNNDLKSAWFENLRHLKTCAQQGLGERFDASVGGGTVLMPFGGEYQVTPPEAMAAKIPVFPGDTTTVSLMSSGFDPDISSWSPFHGAAYAVVEATSKMVAAGGDYRSIRMSLQEYFEKLGKEPSRWGKPFSALLGAYFALTELEIPAIGGKDSMSGSFMELDVPPTLIAFAVDTADARHVVSPEFKEPGSHVIYLQLERESDRLPDFELFKKQLALVEQLISEGHVLAARTVRNGGIAAAVSQMCFGNHIGFDFEPDIPVNNEFLFGVHWGSFLLEIPKSETVDDLFHRVSYTVIGRTIEKPVIRFGKAVESMSTGPVEIPVPEAMTAWRGTLEPVFPMECGEHEPAPDLPLHEKRHGSGPAVKIAKPRVLLTIFSGTNCEYETQAVFENAGAEVDTVVFRNLTNEAIQQSIEELDKKIRGSQIVLIPGGFSAGDEPDGSGKFITSVFRNPYIKDAVMDLLKQRDGLMAGICNGFQALIKLGLVPYGEIRDMTEDSPTLTVNRIGRHISRMVRTRVTSVLSPWFLRHKAGDVRIIPASHGEGRFIVKPEVMKELVKKGQIATQYVDMKGVPSNEIQFNPNGAVNAVEGITSPDGRVLGKMGHAERVTSYVAINIPGNKHLELFESAVEYFK